MEFEGRKSAIDTLGHSLQMAAKILEMYKNGDEKYAHLTDAEMEKVSKQIEEKSAWLNTSVSALEKCPKTVNPSILNCQFVSEKDAFENICRPILNKPKPKVEPPKEEPKKAAAEKTETADKEADVKNAEKMDETSNVNGNAEQTMDLD